ncbi:MAG: sensor histidine kinase [Clostridia bacterium]|jgi:signal transduction histidine kinase
MKLLLAYLRFHIKSIILFLIFTGVFCTVFYLYDIETDAVFYATALCFVLSLIIAAAGFVRFIKKHNALVEMRDNIVISLDQLPEPQTLIEKDYRSMLDILYKQKCRTESDKAMTITEMTDYYTIWVHQIKTPISAMRLILETEGSHDTELDQQLFRIEQYVDMVLTYIRTESSTTDYIIKKYPLDDIVKQAIRKYAKSFIHKKIALEYTDIKCTVLTDEKWLLFVIEQIISNSLKYTNEGRISIYMDRDQPKTLVIEDTGIGIQAEDLLRLCEKGYTGFNGRTDKKSTGIGLYLCKQILKKLSHKMKIESAVGKGTKVFLDLNSENTLSE